MLTLTMTIFLILTFLVSCSGEYKYSGAIMFVATLVCTTVLLVNGTIL